MDIKEARRILNLKKCDREDLTAAVYFIAGWEEAIRRCAEICNASVKEEKNGDGLGTWAVCVKTPHELRDELLKLLVEGESK